MAYLKSIDGCSCENFFQKINGQDARCLGDGVIWSFLFKVGYILNEYQYQ